MGVLRDHNLQKYIDKGYTIFAETGTGNGTAVSHAIGFPFKRIFSCDIDTIQIMKLRERYKYDPRVKLFASNSLSYLNELFNHFVFDNDRVVWFLDSHFPGFDLHGAAIDAEPDIDVRLPLHSELDTLEAWDRANDVIICDDLRIYEKGPFAGKNMDEIGYGHAAAYDHPLPLEPWARTHNIIRDYRDTGYLILEPKTLSV